MLAKFARDDSGSTAIEYGLIAALVFLGILTSVQLATSGIVKTWQNVSDAMTKAVR